MPIGFKRTNKRRINEKKLSGKQDRVDIKNDLCSILKGDDGHTRFQKQNYHGCGLSRGNSQASHKKPKLREYQEQVRDTSL